MMSASFILDRKEQERFKRSKSPLMGLLASRVSCVDCGYTVRGKCFFFGTVTRSVIRRGLRER
jgi:hypothetical protein